MLVLILHHLKQIKMVKIRSYYCPVIHHLYDPSICRYTCLCIAPDNHVKDVHHEEDQGP